MENTTSPSHQVLVLPLSSIPESAGVVPTTSGSNPLTLDGRSSSSSSSTGVGTTHSSRGGLSSALKLKVNHPQQVSHDRGKVLLTWVGRVGWCGKAVVYALIGGLACKSAAGDESPAPVSQECQVSASPQGAFVLLGTVPGGLDIVVLIIMMVALLCYIAWRFGEGLAGQGYDSSFSAKKNFFKFRVSPLVSGCVYVSYLVFIVKLLDSQVQHVACQPGKESWPATWRHNTGGKVGLALLGLAFIIATCIQLQGVLSRKWHRDYRDDLPRPFMRTVFIAGHIGFAGRAAAFLAMAVLFFKDASGAGEKAPHESSMVGNALLQLQQTAGLRTILMIIGILLVVYGLFATLSSVAREFPTLPPTRHKELPAQAILAHQQDVAAGGAADVAAGGAGAVPAARREPARHKAEAVRAAPASTGAVHAGVAGHGSRDDTTSDQNGGFVTIDLR